MMFLLINIITTRYPHVYWTTSIEFSFSLRQSHIPEYVSPHIRYSLYHELQLSCFFMWYASIWFLSILTVRKDTLYYNITSMNIMFTKQNLQNSGNHTSSNFLSSQKWWLHNVALFCFRKKKQL